MRQRAPPGNRRSPIGARCPPIPGRISTKTLARRRRDRAGMSVGCTGATPGRAADHRPGARSGRDRRPAEARGDGTPARLHAARSRRRRSSRSRSSASLSAPAPTAASRICARPRRSPAAGASLQGVRALVVPGSGLVKHQAEEEGLDRIFLEAGFEWREPGCSNCMSMNNDRAEHGERVASTSNPQFRGPPGQERQIAPDGPGDGRRRRRHRPPRRCARFGLSHCVIPAKAWDPLIPMFEQLRDGSRPSPG